MLMVLWQNVLLLLYNSLLYKNEAAYKIKQKEIKLIKLFKILLKWNSTFFELLLFYLHSEEYPLMEICSLNPLSYFKVAM